MKNNKAEISALENVENKKELMEGNKFLKTSLFWVVFIVSFIYILWRLIFTLPLDYGIVSVVMGVLLWVCETQTIIETFTHFNNARNVKIPEMPIITDDMYPEVDVFIATHNESTELLYKTLNGCKYMQYPDKSKIHIHLCDDNNRPEMKKLAEDMGVHYYGVVDNKYAKAGNLNYAFPLTNAPLMAIFDADMIPTSDFLLETVPYFFIKEMIKDNGVWRMRTESDPVSIEKELGYVQTQQSFYNADVLQQNLYMENDAPNEQDYFYRSVNVSRMNTDSAAFAGSNTVFSRKALKEVGWFATHSITEDFATSIEILGNGYRSIALAKELAHGLSPDDVYSFIKQRQRWSRGAAQGIMTRKFWFGKMSLKAKWNFFVAYCYWWTFFRRLVFIICPILYGLWGIRVADLTLIGYLTIWLPYFIIYDYGLKKMSGSTTSALWSDRIDTIQFPYMLKPIILGTLMIPQNKFIVTRKDKLDGKNSSIRLATPHIILALLSILTIIVCLNHIINNDADGAIIVLFWASYNCFSLLSAVVYYFGRVNKRYFERVPAPVAVEIIDGERCFKTKTIDISEGGMAIEMDSPEYIPYERDVTVIVTDNGYKSSIKMQVRQVKQRGNIWIYSMMIKDIEEKEKNEYLQILYDRNHMFPRVIKEGMIKDVKTMYKGLSSKTQIGERRLPRVIINVKLPTDKKQKVYVKDFNYKYITFANADSLPTTFTVMFPDNVKVTCIYDEKLNEELKKNVAIYQVKDWEKLAMNENFNSSLKKLIIESKKKDEL